MGSNMWELLIFHGGEEGLRVEGHIDRSIGFVEVVIKEVLNSGEVNEEGWLTCSLVGGRGDDECNGIVIKEGKNEVDVICGEVLEGEDVWFAVIVFLFHKSTKKI